MPIISIQGDHIPSSNDADDFYPLQVATGGYLIADEDYGQPLAMATGGYLSNDL